MSDLPEVLRRWWAWLNREHLASDCWCVPRRYRRMYQSDEKGAT